jgi:Secretion system C-terminal sorting domain
MKPNLHNLLACSKTVFFGILCYFFSSGAFAQPANDNCSGAVLLTSYTTCNPTAGTLIGATKYTQGINGPTFLSSNWTCPSGVTSAIVECWGGGGAGGGTNNFANTFSGGGGGGAYTINNNVLLTGGNLYNVTVGAGGTGNNFSGANGGTSIFGASLVIANGGAGGTKVDGGIGVGGAGGIGGNFNGGAGATGVTGIAPNPSSGGGGGGAGSTGAGGNAGSPNVFSPGAAGGTDGGIGGTGRGSSAGSGAGGNGATYGGGGGGARATAAAFRVGGNGANGAIRITYADCGAVNSPDVWYTFMAQSANPRIVLSNSGNDLVAQSPCIQLLSRAGGGCGGVYTSLASINANVLQASGLTIGNTYYIRVTTNSNFATPLTGTYSFDICVMDPLPTPTNYIDYAKSYINISDGVVGGTINQGDILEIRATLVVKTGASTITNVSFYDTLKRNAGFIFKDSIATRTNEGKVYKAFTNATGDDAGWLAPTGLDTAIQINIGTGANAAAGGTLTFNSIPNFYSTCIIMATYRVRVDTGTVGYGRKINFGGGAIRYSVGASNYTISFPRDSLIVYPTLAACSDAVSPGNLIGNISNGTFGILPNGSSPSSKQNGTPLGAITTYNYETVSTNVNDYYYGIVNNLSKTNAINQTVEKVGVWPVGIPSRVFDVFDVTGDHTGAPDQARGNKPCDPTKPVDTIPTSPTYNPCGYFMIVNAAYKSDKVFEYTVAGACSETYYEVSAWFKNICYRCGADSLARGSGSAGYIPTGPGDSTGVRPNIAMKIDDIDYYTTGELVYQGLGGTRTGSDTLNNWVRRSFVFKTNPAQTSFKITFRNNAPGGGGNDWAIDDIGLRTCYPTMTYGPPNPIVYTGNSLTITDTVRSYFNNYIYYQWERKPATGGPWAPIAGASGVGNPVYKAAINQYEYVIPYTIPGGAGGNTQAANAGDLYRMVVASNLINLTNTCNYTPSTTFTLLPADACIFSTTNYAVAPQTGSINWNKLNWSLGHIPTCCESAYITYPGSNGAADGVTVNITNDICIINLTLVNTSSTANQIFKTVLDPNYNMLMNGNVRMGAGITATDSCIFTAKGGGTITVNGNTVIGYPSDNAYSIFGSAPGIASYAKYRLRGDSLTFNNRAITNPLFTSITIDPLAPATPVKITNNTIASTLYFDSLRIGTIANPTKAILLGTNGVAFTNDNLGGIDIKEGSEFDMPTNTINAGGTFKSSLYLRANSILKLGGSSNGITGSNFPANFTAYNLDPTSTVLFYGAAQTIPGAANSVNAYGNITLSGTGVKTATASNINLLGNLYRVAGSHTFNSNGGRVLFNSAAVPQKYYADAGTKPIDFYDFTNNNTHASGLSIDSTMGVLNEFELKPSTITTLNTGDIIMRSSAARTSYVTNLGATIPSIVYNTSYRFVVERYLFAKSAWRFLAAPVQLVANDAGTPTVANAWRENNSSIVTGSGYGTRITGPSGPNAEIDANTQRGSMKYFNDAANVWTELTNTTATKIANKPGYMVFVRGDRAIGVGGTTGSTNLRIKGKIRTGDQIFNVLANKFQSFGNPYPARVDFRTISKTNIVEAFTVWDPTIAGLYNVGGYQTYVKELSSPFNYRLNGTGPIRNYIESGEAVFIHTNTAAVGSITVKESDKGTGSTLVSRVGVTRPTLELNMYTKDANGADYLADGVMLNFDNTYSAAIDNLDVRKISNTYDNLAIKNGNYNLVVERRPNLVQTDTINLSITGMRTAAYRFEIDPSVLNYPGLEAQLKDKFLQSETPMSFGAVTTYNFDITSAAASKAADRFMIVFKQAATTNFTTIAATRNADKTVTVNWGTQNETNVANYSVEQSNDGVNFTSIATKIPQANNGTNPTYSIPDAAASKAANWYRVKANNTNNTVKYTGVAMVNALIETATNAEPKMSIYPNPVEDGMVNLHMDNQPQGSYSIQLTNKAGQGMQTETMQVTNSTNMLRTIKLNNTAAGTYQLTVTDAAGKKTNMSFVVK